MAIEAAVAKGPPLPQKRQNLLCKAFRMDIPAITEAEVLAQCAEKNLMLTVAALNDRAVDIRGADFRNAVAVIGSEGQGVRQSLLEAAAQSVIIPMQAHYSL